MLLSHLLTLGIAALVCIPPNLGGVCDDNGDCRRKRKYCEKAPGNCDGTGVCKNKPNNCPAIFDPVCGCDGVTYSNACTAAAEGVNVDHSGPCEPSGQVCGGLLGIPCETPGQFCKTSPGECCCDFFGVCTTPPEGCPEIYDPVCGCDGNTYSNECFADAASVSVDHAGPCVSFGKCCLETGACINATAEQCAQMCGVFGGAGTVCQGQALDCPIPPILASACCLPDGSCTVTTECLCANQGGTPAGVADCAAGTCGGEVCGGLLGIPCEDPNHFCKTLPGECCCDFLGNCTPIPSACPLVFDPVCGCDGMTYTNECFADAAAVSTDFHGPCVNTPCTDNTDCRFPGQLFAEYCHKETGDCNGQGVCTVVPQICLDIYAPVCGCNGQTYDNACYAAVAGVSLDSEGECP